MKNEINRIEFKHTLISSMSLSHLYKTKPSTSYGIIVYTYIQNELRFLMTLRRDTFCYESIIRGLYTDNMLTDYISHITREERSRILNYPFDMLWKDLWVSTKRRLFRIEYNKAKYKFTENHTKILNHVTNLDTFDTELWEFPKGKIFYEETPIQCALREFEEETNIKKSNIILVKKAGTFEDQFTGNDQKQYKSVYYLGMIHNGGSNPFVYHECPHNMRENYVSDEVMSIEWLSYEDAFNRCSPTKQVILTNIYKYLCG